MKTIQQTMDFLLEDRVKLATVSGIYTTKPAIIRRVDDDIPEVEMTTSKSYQVKPNRGNREPIITEEDVGCFGNAVGLKNPGMVIGHEELVALKRMHDLRVFLNVSLSANSIDDFILLIKKFEDVADLLEPNWSCPHTSEGYGSSIGSYPKVVREYMRELRKITNAILIPKLTPNVDNIGEIARIAVEEGADGIAAINTHDPIVYIEPHTGKPILYNPNGHRGGKSGEWIKEIALEKIREIRKAIGNDIPIIGMGGVSTGEDVRNMREAGANVVGIGSVLARVPVQVRPFYFSELKKDAEKGTNNANFFVSKQRQAEYKSHKITRILEKGNDLRVFEAEGYIDYRASQFAFIWVPEVGEKPFSIAKNHPLTFVIRRRDYDADNEKGLVTNALFELEEGDELMVRGVYGANAPFSDKTNAYIIVGGCGIAVVPKLADRLHREGKKVTVYYGVTSKDDVVLDDEIRQYATFIPVEDDGQKGRVLHVMNDAVSRTSRDDACFYNIGPVPFMEEAMRLEQKLGVNAQDIYSSVETNTMCGIGMCGECVCGDRLTCQEGTFFSLDYLMVNQIDIAEVSA